jgi:cell division protein FtsX
VRRLHPELLQWYGLLGAALAWAAQLIVGFGVSYADCTAASRHWGLDVVTWMIVLTAVGVTFGALAEAAALTILFETRDVGYQDAPPEGRRHFFASGAALGNVLFIAAMLITAVGALSNATCRPL